MDLTKIKTKIFKNELTIGSWVTIANEIVVEIMADAGFDWLAIDMEHSSITLDQAQNLIRIIELKGVVPLIRVSSNDPVLIKRVMDAGAYGIIVPMINSKEDAKKAVESVYYPPKGKRGVGLARAQKYGFGFDEYKKWLLRDALVIAQIEHIDAINNLEEILNVAGVDASIIGPYDLSASMGCPGEFNRPSVKKAILHYCEVCKRMNKAAGYHVVPVDVSLLKEKISQGFSFLGFSLDTLFLATKINEQLGKIKI